MNSLQNNNNWTYNQNFSFQRLFKENRFNESAKSALFNGTIIEDNNWDNVDITNSDIETTRILKTTIKNSHLDNTDIHSIYVVDTDLENVTFCGANIVDCVFINCTFVDCNFEGAILTNCNFKQCDFNHVNLLHGSFTLNTFSECLLESMCFKNVFYYTHFEMCKFNDVIFEAYLLGYSYGLTIENMSSFQYLIMGKDTVDNYVDICKKVKEIYQDRILLINTGILYLLDPEMPATQAIVKCFECLKQYIERDLLIKNEQLQFLKRIVENMYKNNIIAPIVLVKLLHVINQILCLNSNISLTKAKPDLIQIKNNVLVNYYKFIDNLSETIISGEIESNAIIEIVYEEQPQYCLADILNEITGTRNAYVIETKECCFVEIIQCVYNMLPILEIFLAVLGITIPIIWDIRKSKAPRKTETEHIFEINNRFYNSTVTPDIVETSLASTEAIVKSRVQEDTGKTIRFIINNEFINSSTTLGYSNENIRSIKISQNS